MSEALINGLAGAAGGIVAQLITYPLQTVNTRQQTETKLKKTKDHDFEGTPVKQIQKTDGTLQQMCQVIGDEGWGRLYGGLIPSLVGTAVSQGIYYYFYQIFRTKAERIALNRRKNGIGDGSVGMFSSLVVAACAGCLNVLLTNPIWVVVTRMQVWYGNFVILCSCLLQMFLICGLSVGVGCDICLEVKSHLHPAGSSYVLTDASLQTHSKIQRRDLNAKADGPITQPPETTTTELILPDIIEVHHYGTGHVVQEVYGEAGLLGFWKGVMPTLIMVSNPSIQFMLYETFLKRIRAKRALRKQGIQNISALEIFLLGALAKLGATVITYPLLVVKSRLQAKQETNGDKTRQYTGTLDAIAKVIHHEGLSGLYKGMSTKIVQSVFAAAILFMIKEELVEAIREVVTRNRKPIK